MVEGVISIFIELILPLLLAVAEIALLVLVASIRPWRYALSRSYRARIDAELAQRRPIARYWYLFSGLAAILGSIAVVVMAAWLYRSHSQEPGPGSWREKAMHRMREGKS